MIRKVCLQCENEFDAIKNRQKYCSSNCFHLSTRGRIAWNKNKSSSKETKKKVSGGVKKWYSENDHPMKGKHLSEEFKERISNKLKGRKLSKEHRENISKAFKEDKHPNWKGDDAGYRALHIWVNRYLGLPKICKHCRKKAKHWANKSGEYKRDLNDWISLCVPCHKKYDIKNKLTKSEE